MANEQELTVQCPHGYTFALPLTTVDRYALRDTARELLLACPRCNHEARGFLPDLAT